MTRSLLPNRLQRGQTQTDTWTMRARTLVAKALATARTPHTIQLMPIRMTVVRPRRTIRGTIRSGLVDLAVVGCASAAAYYLGRHPERARAARGLLASTRRTMAGKLHHNGAGDPQAADSIVRREPATV